MSVDLSLIILNNCQSLRDTQNAKKCFDDTIDPVIKHFHGRKQFVTEISIRSNEDDPDDIEYSFGIPFLTGNPIDNCRTNFNGAGIQVFKGEKSAFFNMEGEQLTDFRVGNFSWKWDTRCIYAFRQIIIDEATGRKFLSDGTSYEE